MTFARKADLELNVLAEITPYMDLNKKRLLLNAFFMPQFNYCQLVWMCHNRTKSNKINRLHERCLRLIYNEKKFSFEELLEIIVLSLFTIEILEIMAFQQLS